MIKNKKKIVLIDRKRQKERYYKKAKELEEEKFNPEENMIQLIYGPPAFEAMNEIEIDPEQIESLFNEET